MHLISKERLRTFLGTEPDKISARTLARYVGVHPSFIDHLTSGRRRSCGPATAQLIANTLAVPIDVLFRPAASTSRRGHNKREAA